MMIWLFGGIALLAAAVAAFTSDTRRAILLLWLAGMSCGCVFLACESEILAATQWAVSTLVCLVLLYFTLLLGEHREKQSPLKAKKKIELKLISVLAVPVAAGFGALIFLASPPVHSLVTPKRSDLHAFSEVLAKNEVISIEVLALTLLAAGIGTGILARSEEGEKL